MLISSQPDGGRLPGESGELASAVSSPLQLNQMHALGQLSSLGQLQSAQQLGAYAALAAGHRGSLSQHNTLGRRAGNGHLAGGQPISNYATISRAAHGQLMNGGQLLNGGHLVGNGEPLMNGHPLGQTLGQQLSQQMSQQLSQQMSQQLSQQLNQQLTSTMSHPSLGNGHLLAGGGAHQLHGQHPAHLYGSSPYLQQRPQFVGLEVGLELVDKSGCCCFSSVWRRRCNLARVIAFICGIVVVFLMTLCIASSNWLTSEKYRQGLWEYCLDEGAAQPLPFNLNVEPGCYAGRDVGYIRLAGILCSFGLVFDFFATVMTGLGLCSNNPHRKYTLYRFALYVMIASLIVILTALVVYPAYFAAEIETSNRQIWEFGWAYGVGWGASIFLFGAVLLLLCDKETEEIYYKERTIVHSGHNGQLKA